MKHETEHSPRSSGYISPLVESARLFRDKVGYNIDISSRTCIRFVWTRPHEERKSKSSSHDIKLVDVDSWLRPRTSVEVDFQCFSLVLGCEKGIQWPHTRKSYFDHTIPRPAREVD